MRCQRVFRSLPVFTLVKRNDATINELTAATRYRKYGHTALGDEVMELSKVTIDGTRSKTMGAGSRHSGVQSQHRTRGRPTFRRGGLDTDETLGTTRRDSCLRHLPLRRKARRKRMTSQRLIHCRHQVRIHKYLDHVSQPAGGPAGVQDVVILVNR
jgi:hypothetical protein